MDPSKDQKKANTKEIIKNYRYPGSRPFDIDEEKIFYGRENEITKLSNLVELEKLVVVYARSGLGKTSLINAGLIPKLKEKKLDFRKLNNEQKQYSSLNKYAPIIHVRFNNPALRPDQILINELKKHINENHLINPQKSNPWDYIKAINRSIANTPILIFDQFEELFNLYSKSNRKKFITEFSDMVNDNTPFSVKEIIEEWITKDDSLLDNHEELNEEQLIKIQSCENPIRLKVIIAIRSDKLSNLDELSKKIPLILNNRYKLNALSKDQARLAISAPGKMEGTFTSPTFTYDREVLSKMVDFLSTEKMDDENIGTDNVESFQLQILCQYIESELIKRNPLGELVDTISSGEIKIDNSYLESVEKMKDVLENFYENIINEKVSGEIQPMARQLIESGLIVEGYRNSLSKIKIINHYQVPEVTLSKLVNSHILRHERRLGQDFYEISHDTLVGPIMKAHERRLQEEKDQHVTQLKEEKENLLQKDIQKSKYIKILNILLASLIIGFTIIGFLTYKWRLSEQEKRKTISSLASQTKETQQHKGQLMNERKTKELIYQSIISHESDPTLSYRLAEAALKLDSQDVLAQKNLFDLIKSSTNFPFYSEYNDNDISVKGYSADFAISKNGKLLLASQKGEIYSLDNEGTIEKIEIEKQRNIYQILFFPKSDDRYLTAGDKGVFIRNLKSSRTKLLPHKNTTVDAIAISKDGKLIISGDRKGTIKLWKSDSGYSYSVMNSSEFHNGQITNLFFSDDGKRIFSTSWDKRVKVIDTESLEVLFEEKLENRIMSADFDGIDQLVIGLDDGSIKLWKFNEQINPANIIQDIDTTLFFLQNRPTTITKEVLSSYKAHHSTVNNLKFIFEGKYFLSASSDNSSKMWSQKGNLVKTFLGHTKKVDAIIFNGENVFTVSSSNDSIQSEVLKWSLNIAEWTETHTGEIKCILENNKYIVLATVQKDSTHVEIGTELHIYDQEKKQLIKSIVLPIKLESMNKTYSKDIVLLTGMEKRNNKYRKKIYELNLISKKTKSIPPPHFRRANILDLESINIHEVITIGSHKKIIRWTLNNHAKDSVEFSQKDIDTGCCLDFERETKLISSGHDNGKVYLWNLDGKLVNVIKAHNKPITAIKMASNAKFMLTASTDKNIKFWSIIKNANGEFELKLKHTFKGHHSKITQLDISPKDNIFLSASNDGTVKLWFYNLKKDKFREVPALIRHEQGITSAIFAKNGDEIYTGSKDKTVKLWKRNKHFNHISTIATLNEEVEAIITEIGEEEIQEINQRETNTNDQ